MLGGLVTVDWPCLLCCGPKYCSFLNIGRASAFHSAKRYCFSTSPEDNETYLEEGFRGLLRERTSVSCITNIKSVCGGCGELLWLKLVLLLLILLLDIVVGVAFHVVELLELDRISIMYC